LLPIGTVVKLKELNYEVMVYGYFVKDLKKKKLFIYSGQLYPYGLINFDFQINFNPQDVEKIIFVGYSGDEYKAFNFGINKGLESLGEK